MTGISVDSTGVWLAGGNTGQAGITLEREGTTSIYKKTLKTSYIMFKFRNGYNPNEWWSGFETIAQQNNQLCVTGDWKDRVIYPTSNMTYSAEFTKCPTSYYTEVTFQTLTLHTNTYITGYSFNAYPPNQATQERYMLMNSQSTTSIFNTFSLTVQATPNSQIRFIFSSEESIAYETVPQECRSKYNQRRLVLGTTPITFFAQYGKCEVSNFSCPSGYYQSNMACMECADGETSFAGSTQCYNASEMFNALGADVSRQDIIGLYSNRNFDTCSS